MIIIGVDFHPEFQQIASVDTDSGEIEERRLQHPEEAVAFYRGLASAGKSVRVGMEASGYGRWFEGLLCELQLELWIGDAAEIRTKRVRKQKTDRQDAQLILKLMLEDRFPRIWVPSWENRDLRQLLWHRHRMVQARTRIMNQLQAGGAQSRLALQEAVVAGARTAATGSLPLSTLGESATTGSAGAVGSTEPDHRGAQPSDRAGSGKVSCSTTLDDPSWGGPVNRSGFRADHRRRTAISLRQADYQLCGTGAVGGIQWQSPTAGAYHQAGEFDVALSAGGSGAGNGAQPSGMAQQVFSPDDAAGAKDC